MLPAETRIEPFGYHSGSMVPFWSMSWREPWREFGQCRVKPTSAGATEYQKNGTTLSIAEDVSFL